MTVKQILNMKGSHTPTVLPGTKISTVIAALEAEEVGALVVSSDGKHIEGIISERDVVRGLLSLGKNVLNHKVSELMSSDVITCTAHDPVAGIMAIMDDRNIRHVPVVDEGKLAGIVSIRDIIKLRLDEVQADADAMRRYISNS